jgi:hypothetical protein
MSNYTKFTGPIPLPERVSASAMKLLKLLYDGADFRVAYEYGDVTPSFNDDDMDERLWLAYRDELCHYGYVEQDIPFGGQMVTERLGRVRQAPLLHHTKDSRYEGVYETITLSEAGRKFVEQGKAED